MSSKKRNKPSPARNRPAPAPPAQLIESRAELRATIAKLKAMGCEDSMVLVEFWHALDFVNGEDDVDL